MDTDPGRRVIDIRLLADLAWKRKQLFFTTIIAAVALIILYLHIAVPAYTVSMEVSPASDSKQDGGGQLGALSKLAGLDLAVGSDSAVQFRLFLSALTSRDVADVLAENQPLMRVMFPHEWSQTEKKWVAPDSLLHPVVYAVKELLGLPIYAWRPPNGERVQEYLKTNLEVYEDPKSPVVTLRIESDKPETANKLLLALTTTVDSVLRQRALRRANDYAAYLLKELKRETVAEYRETLLAHLAQQEQTLMMANASVSFSMQVFNIPSSSQYPSSPKGLVLLVSAIVFGAIFGLCLSILAETRGWPLAIFAAAWARIRRPNDVIEVHRYERNGGAASSQFSNRESPSDR